MKLVISVVTAFVFFVATVDLPSTIVRTHIAYICVHVQDLYMYTYAQYCCQTSLKLSKLHETAGVTDNCKETFMFFSAGSIETLVCHSQMLRGGFLALKNTIII